MTMSTEETQVEPAQTQNAPEATKTAPEVVTPEVETAPAEEAKPEPTPEEDAERAKRSMQRRIDKRTADLYRERANNEQLVQRLSALEQRLQGAPEQLTQEYLDARKAQIDPIALAKEIATVERITERANEVAKAGEKQFGAEFRASLNTVAEEAGPLFQPSGKTTPLGDAILDSEDPAGLLHHLGKNPDLAAELAGLSAAALGRRIGRIEDSMAKQAVKPVSRAPTPAKPIAANRSTGALQDMDMDAYVAARKAQGARWAR